MRERRADGDLVPERTDAREVVGTQPREELRAGAAQQRQVALHAAGHIQHHNEADGLRTVVELDDRLRLPLIAHFEVVLPECGHQPAVSIRDRDEDAYSVAPGAKDRLLRPGRAEHANDSARPALRR